MTAPPAKTQTPSISLRRHSSRLLPERKAWSLSPGFTSRKPLRHYRHVQHDTIDAKKKEKKSHKPKIHPSIPPSRRERSNRFGARAVAVRRPYNPSPTLLSILLNSTLPVPHSRLPTMSGVDPLLERLVSRRVHRFLGLLLLLVHHILRLLNSWTSRLSTGANACRTCCHCKLSFFAHPVRSSTLPCTCTLSTILDKRRG